MKEAYPLQATKYAVTNQLEHKLAFAWWVGYTLQHAKQIIKAMKIKHYHNRITEVDNLQGVPPTGGEGETMVTP